MKVAIAGSTGLIGKALSRAVITKGYTLIRLVRDIEKDFLGKEAIFWNPENHTLDADQLEGVDVLINLCGDNIATQRWSLEKKHRILTSRVNSSKLLAQTVASMKNPPKVFINASAIGYYGDRGNCWLTEKEKKGKGFLSDVCQEWEAATKMAKNAGIRTVNLRIGVVLSLDGGALKKMLLPFKLGLGGVIGTGKQYISWISIDDLVRIFFFLIDKEQIAGPVNAVSPNPVTNQEFTKTLAKLLNRPSFFSMPAFLVKILMGQMGQELLLSSQRVKPQILEENGFVFKYPFLEMALKELLNHSKKN